MPLGHRLSAIARRVPLAGQYPRQIRNTPAQPTHQNSSIKTFAAAKNPASKAYFYLPNTVETITVTVAAAIRLKASCTTHWVAFW